ncbi:hypothetical protein CCACVL1_21714 [Corchorus capsularis]|uniref:Uncharacterized protein n=1 Tax=Corchorus capsularis TaxID=210143 RepID=A0A1R3H292_COCAP|nr:hypothetical protein CCACVL1_21714 [Corchorus capsularis]
MAVPEKEKREAFGTHYRVKEKPEKIWSSS